MFEQFITRCRRCGKQILMTRNIRTGAWVPCDPEVRRYIRADGPETYVTPEGVLLHGVRDNRGDIGYRRHRRDCA